MWRDRTAALIVRFATQTCSYVASGNDGPPSTWHITQWLFRIFTISRSKRTVVFTVSCGAAGRAKTRAASVASASVLAVRRKDIEREREGVDFLVAAELRPRAIAPGLRHQPFARHVGAAAELLEIRARGDPEDRRSAVVVRLRDDVERMRVDVLGHVLAHDQRVAERAEIRLQIGDRLSGRRVRQVIRHVAVED